MRRVLITGASGALGRAVVAHLKTLDYDVTTIGRQAAVESPAAIRCDIRDSMAFVTAVARANPQMVVHLAAKFTSSVAEAYRINVEPAQRLLEHIHASKARTRVVLVGSAAEYGAVRPDDNPIREDRVLMPVSAYGVSKAWQTQLVAYYASCGVDVVCARIFNLYGPGISSSLFAGRVQNQIDEVKVAGRSEIEVGSLTAIRDYVSTDQAARQLHLIATRGEPGMVYHIASGIPVTMRDLLIRQLEANGLSFSIVREAPNLSNHTGYDVPAIFADMTKTMTLESASAYSG